MEFEIYTYGHMEGMFYTLNALAMILNSDFIDSLIKLVAFSTTGYYGIKLMSSLSSGERGTLMMKNITMLVMVNALIIPKADMILVDRITGKKEPINNLPYAFVLPVGLFEAIGAGIVGSFEQSFSKVNSTSFKDYGMLFGSRLVQESRNWRISNPEFISNLDIFTKRCIVLESQIGRRFTPNDIVESEDIMGLVTESAGHFRLVDLTINGKVSRLSCREAADELNKYWSSEYGVLSYFYRNHDFGLAGIGLASNAENQEFSNLNHVLAKNISVSYKGRLGTNVDAAQVIRQTMMINALKDSTNKRDKYGYSRAAKLQDSNWKIAGQLAAEYLPLTLNILKAVIYASFVFIVPLMIISGGWSKYTSYIQVVASLQLWPALNSVLNLFIELYSSNTALPALTLGTFNQMHDSADKMVAIASGMQAMIPYLSFIIVQGGVGGFIHAANTMNSTTQSAAATAASEVTSGNRSFGNLSENNLQYATQSAFKIDRNQSYAVGASREQLSDGMIENVTTAGQVFNQTGQGINIAQTANKLDLVSEERNSNMTALNKEQQHMKELRAQYSENDAHQMQNMESYVKGIARRMDSGQDINFNQLGRIGEDLQKAVNHERTVGDAFHYDKTQDAALKAGIEASADTGNLMGAMAAKGLKYFGKIPGMELASKMAANKISNIPGADKAGGLVKDAAKLVPGVEVKANVGGHYTASDTTRQGVNDTINNTKADHTNINWGNVREAALNDTFNKHVGVDDNLSSDIRSTVDRSNSLSQDINMSQNRIESLSSRQEYLESAGSNFNVEGTSHVIDNLVGQGMNVRSAQRLVENPAAASPEELVMFSIAKKQVTHELLSKISPVSNNSNLVDQGNHENTDYKKQINQFAKEKIDTINNGVMRGHNDVTATAHFDGINRNEVDDTLKQQQAALQVKNQEIKGEVIEQITKGKVSNEEKYRKNEEEVNKAEENRKLKAIFGTNKPQDRE